MSTLDSIKRILAEQLGVDENSITEETAVEELGADSLDLVEIIFAIEEEFNIKIEDDSVEGLKKVGDIVSYIANK